MYYPFLLTTIFFLVLLLLLHRYSFEKKIGDKKELDIKFDDFLTNLFFQI
jgi:hypothetical protein